MNSLEGKVALITGAKGGLGNHVTEAFLSAGARVAGVSRSIQARDFPHANFTPVAAELGSLGAAQAAVQQVKEMLGRVDILVHLVGTWAGGARVGETDDATFDRMLDTNLKSSFHIFRAVLPLMEAQGAGRILAIGSKAAVEPQASSAAYNASKAALVSLVRTTALEYGTKGITANIVLPGTMDTPVNRSAMPGADFSKWVQPAQVASLLAYLASAEASQVTGTVIPVYGAEG